MCRAKESPACVLVRYFSSYSCSQNNRVATTNLRTVIQNWACNTGEHRNFFALPSTQSPDSHPWFLPHILFPHVINHQDLLIFPPFLNSDIFTPTPLSATSFDYSFFEILLSIIIVLPCFSLLPIFHTLSLLSFLLKQSRSTGASQDFDLYACHSSHNVHYFIIFIYSHSFNSHPVSVTDSHISISTLLSLPHPHIYCSYTVKFLLDF